MPNRGPSPPEQPDAILGETFTCTNLLEGLALSRIRATAAQSASFWTDCRRFSGTLKAYPALTGRGLGEHREFRMDRFSQSCGRPRNFSLNLAGICPDQDWPIC
jgi:hypothetical protein